MTRREARPQRLVLAVCLTVVCVYADVAVVRTDDEDACHDRVAGGADHDGADHEGADARLVGADLVSGRFVEGSCDVLRCVCCGIALRLCLARRGERAVSAGRRVAGGVGSGRAGGGSWPGP